MSNAFDHYSDVWKRVRVPENGKPLQNNTRLFKRSDDCFAIRLHATDVVTVFADGSTVLSTGGWFTVTTKDRITSYSDVTIRSQEGIWYVSHRKARDRAERKARKEFGLPARGSLWDVAPEGFNYRAYYRRIDEMSEVPFFDGITFNKNGTCVNGISPVSWNDYKREVKRVKKLIQGYCTGYYAAMKRGMPAPGPGDCWFCGMIDESGKPLGDVSENNEHLWSHIEERYYVPSLMVNALRAKGYPDMGVGMHMEINQDGTMGGERWASRQYGMGGGTCRRALRDYLTDRLVPNPPGINEEATPKRGLRSTMAPGSYYN